MIPKSEPLFSANFGSSFSKSVLIEVYFPQSSGISTLQESHVKSASIHLPPPPHGDFSVPHSIVVVIMVTHNAGPHVLLSSKSLTIRLPKLPEQGVECSLHCQRSAYPCSRRPPTPGGVPVWHRLVWLRLK